ncbi:RloB domain-containing protein [Enterococcus faecalis]|uniref:RloB family protein n=1 Tax=Enterococcus faecalis TaxID=1351 RepID=UPI0018E8948A|nr:RloB family protein [Enterococcus faecalis]MBJ0431201.1 RloB domain-containing protein [Enterococcus faecalis]
MPKIKRVKKGKKLKPNVMIFCEGETEEAYLRLIKRKYSAVNIKSKLKVKTCRRQGEALVEYAVSCIRSMGKAERDNYDLFYVMYDKDEQTTESIENAVRCAQRHRPEIKTIFSNECFELWLLLHFEEVNRYMTRENLYGRLEKVLHLKDSYRNFKGAEVCEYLEEKVAIAFQNTNKNWLSPLEEMKINENPYTNFPKELCEMLAQKEVDF